MINVAVAITGNGGIGLKGGLPWPHLKGDMYLFSKRTTGSGNNAVIMGKNTWLSIPENRRPLKNRTNIIISSSLQESSCRHIFSSIRDAITHCEAAKYDEVWIIGGSGIYNDFLNVHHDKVHRVYITYVCTNSDGENYECDTFIDIPADSYLVEECECIIMIIIIAIMMMTIFILFLVTILTKRSRNTVVIFFISTVETMI